MRGFIEELKRRNVAKVALVYIIAGWLTMQVVDVMFPALQLPEWLISAVAAFVIIGFPFAVIFAWAFEMTPDGLKREKDPGGPWALIMPFFDEAKKDPRWADYRAEFGL